MKSNLQGGTEVLNMETTRPRPPGARHTAAHSTRQAGAGVTGGRSSYAPRAQST